MIYAMVGETSSASGVLALDKESGVPVWRRGLAQVADQPPVVAGDLLFVVSRGRELLALQRLTGEPRWSFRAGTLISGRPVVEGGVLYVGADAVYALDAATGDLRWQRHLDGRILHPLALSAAVLAAVGGDHSIYLLNAHSGKPRLSFPLWFNPTHGPFVVDDVVAVAGDRGHVQALALQAKDRFGEKPIRFLWTRLWLYGSFPPPPLPPGYAWQVRNEAASGRLLGAGDGRFYLALDYGGETTELVALAGDQGTILWRLPFSGPLTSSLLLHGDRVIATTRTGEMIGVGADVGEIRWRLALPGPVAATPALSGERLFVPLADGTLHALVLAPGD
jgi:hypothetical protein